MSLPNRLKRRISWDTQWETLIRETLASHSFILLQTKIQPEVASISAVTSLLDLDAVPTNPACIL